uniref:Uncharacterized protein n=1 Tax=Timema monikensis TaxID=170555 RepID=A0A7R9EHC4_9NEOP|nr:unnamed protein product [Timema monikensis]
MKASTKKESPSKRKKLAKNQELITLDNKVVFDVKEKAEVNDKTTEKNEEGKEKEDEDKSPLTKKGDNIKEKKTAELKEYIEAQEEDLIDHVESIVVDELVGSAGEDITSSEPAVKVKKIKKKKPIKTESELSISETTPELSLPSEDKSEPPAATLLKEESTQEQASGVIVFDELGGNVKIKMLFNTPTKKRLDKDVVQRLQGNGVDTIFKR